MRERKVILQSETYKANVPLRYSFDSSLTVREKDQGRHFIVCIKQGRDYLLGLQLLLELVMQVWRL